LLFLKEVNPRTKANYHQINPKQPTKQPTTEANKMTYEKKLIDDYFSTWFNLTKDIIDIRQEYKEAERMRVEYNKKFMMKWKKEEAERKTEGLVECSCGNWLKKITGSHLKAKKHLGN
jgi:hypothetical protein